MLRLRYTERMAQQSISGVPRDPAEGFTLDSYTPRYVAALADGSMADKVAWARRELRECRACPRNCGVNRRGGELGICRTGRDAIVASAFPHHGEEDCLRGRMGSGAIFFAWCNLRCVFCQNWDISQRPSGRTLTADALADVMLSLQGQGCHNINFVTPEHVVPQVAEGLAKAAVRGLRLPIVYNTSAYDSLDSIRMLDGLIDIYMPDFKCWEMSTARELLKAEDYPGVARSVIAEMHRQAGPLRFTPDGMAQCGVLVRHLVMPGQEAETAAILAWLAGEISPDTYVNIMGQYHPEHKAAKLPEKYASIARRPCTREMQAAFEAAHAAGLWRIDSRWM